MIELRLKRNPEYVEGMPRYFLDMEADLSEYLRKGIRARIPVFWKRNVAPHPTLKEIYYAEIAGVKLEKGNPIALEKIVTEAILGLISYGTLPYYFINLPDGTSISVYLVDGKLQTKLREVQFSGDDIGQLWNSIGDYLVTLREIERKEEVLVNIFLWADLRLYPPALILRINRVWIPIFSYGEGTLNYDVIGVPSKIVPVQQVLELCKEIASELLASRVISSPHDLRMDQVSDEVCDELAGASKETEWVLSYYEDERKVDIPILETGGELFALQRSSGPKIYFGRDIEDLRRRVAEELGRAGVISTSSYLTLEQRR